LPRRRGAALQSCSEVMRHVDLFVGVSSIGNDPTWNDRGDARDAGYWSNYAFSEHTPHHSGVAGSQAEDRRSLLVGGSLPRRPRRPYRIHLGSSNILMEPNDQYLCIVPGRGVSALREKLYVPFEGDSMLSVIVSKAFLLAEDRKITDETILRQLNR